VTVACTACHINNTFAGTPTDCYSCHKTDYTTTNNPNHVAANFPTTCATCHTTTAWTGATFTHSQFPIYSGTHANAWTTCADCHTNASNFQMFSCITCHTHTQAATDPHHTGVKGYVYAATTCYSCHPNGTGGH
jgi:predicted CXXCH cytochrome family protein